MKSQAVTTFETVTQAVEAVRREAGPSEIDQMAALVWLEKAAERAANELKSRIRVAALMKLSEGNKVPMSGRLGVTQVTFMPPTVKLRPDADRDQLKRILGDRIEELFTIIPEKIEPVKGFRDALDHFDGPKPIIDLVEAAVSYSDRSARVQPPRAPKV